MALIRYLVLMILCICVLFPFLPVILSYLGAINPIFLRYVGYVTTEVDGTNLSSLLRFFELLIFGILYPRAKKIDKRASLFFVSCIIAFLVSLIGFYNAYTKRLGIFFQLPANLFFFSVCGKCFTRNSRFIVNALVIVYQLLVFFISAYLFKQANLIPYSNVLTMI